MSQHARLDQPRLLPAFLAAACGLASTCQLLAQDGGNPFAAGAIAADSADVTVSEHLTVDLHVQDEELANVLQILSLQSQKNILVSGTVSATVNANLYNVTFYEALDAILNVNGYGYVEKGNFIYVYTLEEIADLEQAARQPVTRVVRLNYLNANDAAEFVSPLLSEVGQIQSNGDVDTFSIPDGSPVGDETYALASTLVIRDYPEHVEEIEKLIAELDTRPAQVLVEATILETSLREMNGFGVDFSFISDLDFSEFIDLGGPLGTTQGIINGGDGSSGGLSPANNQALSGTSTPGNTAAGPATFKLGIIDDNISFFLRALDDITDVTVLSRPKVLALNRQPARVLVGRRIGYLSTTSTETSTTQTVEFLDTGTQLKFRAFVGNDGFIRMELHPSTSTGETREASSAGGAAVTIPEEVTQEITTNVLVRDGSTVVLGGLFRESTTLSRRQVPLLGDIPLIGAAFRGHDDDTRRSEIIFMITPTIVNDQILTEIGNSAGDYVENVRVGSRSGLLPWSRDRQSAELNVKAEQAALDGDAAKGLYLLRRSLELNPNQPDAIRLREQLLQQQSDFPSRSILEDAFDEELNDRLRSIEPLPLTLRGDFSPATKSTTGDTIVAGPLPDEAANFTLSLPPEMHDELFAKAPAAGHTPSDAALEPPAPDVFSSAPVATDHNSNRDTFELSDEVFDRLIAEAEAKALNDEFTADDFAASEFTADDFATYAPAVTSGRTTSPAMTEEERLLQNLRLTVTVAPRDEELAAETGAPKASVPAPTRAKPWQQNNALKSAAVSGPASPKSAPASADRSLADGANFKNWDDFNEDSQTPAGTPGLIGPAYALTEGEKGLDDLGIEDPFFGGFWIWFRDAVVLDHGAAKTNDALTEVDPDQK